MKIIYLIIVFIFLQTSPTYADVNTYIVTGDNNLPPYEYVDEDGVYKGFNVDIIKAIGLTMGEEFVFKPMAWENAYHAIENDEADIIQGLKISEDRKKKFIFSNSFLENTQSIFVLKENKDINNLSDLKNKKVGLLKEDTLYETIKDIDNITISQYNSLEEILNLLLNEEIDALIGNTLTVNYLSNKEKTRENIKIVGSALNKAKYTIAVSPENKELLSMINKGIKEIHKNGMYDIIYRKWFGSPINQTNKLVSIVILVSVIILFIFCGVILIIEKINLKLKKEVENKTHEQRLLVNKLKVQNRQLSEEKTFREIVLNNILTGVLALNFNNEVIFLNDVGKEIFSDLEIKDRIYQIIQNYEYKQSSETISDRYIEYVVTSIEDVDEHRLKIIIFKDYTESKIMEDEIQRNDKLRFMDKIISSIAHEIRNPLTAIKTYADLIPKKLNNKDFQKSLTTDIPREIDRIDSLIKEFIEYTSPRKPLKEELKLYDEFSSALMFIKNQLKGISINIDIEKTTKILFDRNHLRQIIINILLNSKNALEDTNKPYININTINENNDILITIKDNGKGIEEDNLQKIFDPFYTTRDNGNGLGLFVVKKLVNENNGLIYAKSAKNEGMALTIKVESVS